jgi:hypothetical protein
MGLGQYYSKLFQPVGDQYRKPCDGRPQYARARGTIKGIGADEQEIYNPVRKIQEVVHTYG